MNESAGDRKPTVHRHEGCGIEYLLGAKQVLFETGSTMDRFKFDKTKDDPAFENTVRGITDEAHTGFDWQYACSTGQLRRKKSDAGLAASAKPRRRRAQQVEKVREIQVEEQEKKAVKGYIFSSVFLVTVVMLLVGIGSAIMSAYHTSAFLVYGGKPVWTSVMTGTMLILFSGTAFTAARYFFREGGALNFFAALFVTAGLVVIAYSMFSTLTVNYNQFQWRDDEKAAAAVEGSEALAAHREQIRFLEEEIANISMEIARAAEEANHWRNTSWRRYDEATRRLSVLEERRHTLRERRTELVRETPRLVEVEAVSRETVYGFLAGLFTVKEDAMRFFVYVVPACLYDILAPFALSVVLLLMDKKKQNGGQNLLSAQT